MNDIRDLLKPVLEDLKSKGWLAPGLSADCSSCSLAELSRQETDDNPAFVFWHEQDAPEYYERGRLADEEIGDSKDDGVIKRAFDRVYDIPDEALDVTCDDIALRYNGNTITDLEAGNIIKETCLAHNVYVEWDGDPRKTIIAKNIDMSNLPDTIDLEVTIQVEDKEPHTSTVTYKRENLTDYEWALKMETLKEEVKEDTAYNKLHDEIMKRLNELGEDLYVSPSLERSYSTALERLYHVRQEGRTRFVMKNWTWGNGNNFQSKIYDSPTWMDSIIEANRMLAKCDGGDHRFLEAVSYLKTTPAGINHLTFWMGS